MNYNFRPDVRGALARARDAALELGHDYVGTEHILLGLIADPASPGTRLLAALGLEAPAVREQVNSFVRKGRTALGLGELPYTSRAKKTLELTMAEARAEGVDYIDTVHLLLGLLREEKGIAAQVLMTLGIDAETVRATGANGGVPPEGTGREGGRRGDSALRVTLDDASDRSIYEQIVDRVQEAVATGELAPGDRLPSVRSLADRLDIAPGTVARAYSELERRGVVVTEGARGTRVAEPAPPSPAPAADLATLTGLLRPAAVAAFHMGATVTDMRRALEQAMSGIFDDQDT